MEGVFTLQLFTPIHINPCIRVPKSCRAAPLKKMRVTNWFSVILVAATAVGILTTQIVRGVQLSDGTVYFVQPPRLVSATTTFNNVNMWSSTYYFTLFIPENAGEPLQRVAIALRDQLDFPRFYLEETIAFEGTSRRRGETFALTNITRDERTQTLSVTFDPPVPPGKTVTIRWRPVRNPRYPGIYLFGVTAFPAGEKAHGQFLGFGRLHFYRGTNRHFH